MSSADPQPRRPGRKPASEPTQEPARKRRGRGRGRVVMLVDNGVEGDSRVQKQARSMAERGWDVVLLGKSPDNKEHRWRLGEARVRLVPVSLPLAKRRYEFRRAPLRSPLAYAPGRMAKYAERKALARREEARTMRAALDAKLAEGESSPVTALPQRAWVLGHRAYAKAYGELVGVRLSRTAALQERREKLDAPLDRLTTSFWQKTMGKRAWRQLDPSLWDWELAMGPVVDQLKPDLIHANDFRMLGVGARAKVRARAEGRRTVLVWDAHEYLPGMNPWNSHPRWHKAMIAHEAEYAPYADAVTTVSEMMVDLLVREHHLTVPTAIVRNAPVAGPDPSDPGPTVRDVAGLDPDVPLILYVGVMTPARGVDTLVEALPQLDGVHLGFVARPSANLERILAKARNLGVRDRVHHLPYVEVDRICSYIATADLGISPALHLPNHDVDLPTKFYEYTQARLPVVVSDAKTISETTRTLGVGEVFAAGNPDDFARAVRDVLADKDRYAKAYVEAQPVLAQWLWDNQADVLDSVYTDLLTR
jgi:glycogen synthase